MLDAYKNLTGIKSLQEPTAEASFAPPPAQEGGVTEFLDSIVANEASVTVSQETGWWSDDMFAVADDGMTLAFETLLAPYHYEEVVEESPGLAGAALQEWGVVLPAASVLPPDTGTTETLWTGDGIAQEHASYVQPVLPEAPQQDTTIESVEHGDPHTDHVIEDNNAFLMAMGEGSRIEIHAADAAKDSWTQLNGTVVSGETSITVSEVTGWEIGDKIAIAASGGQQHHEARTIFGVSEDGMTFELDAPLDHYHYGEIDRYDNGLYGPDRQEWNVDMRAEVALLSRNVTIQGDEDSIEDGFGAHTMVMNGAMQHISGAEFYRVGQEDILGRYPVHWHMLDDAAGQYVQNVSVHHSFNKGMTIHGTFNARLENNAIFDHIGHGVFLEDGSEFGSQILGNLVFGTKRSETGLPIPTDKDQVSSYWIENASVTMIGNHAAGSEDTGIWILPAQNGAHGLSGKAYSPDAYPLVSGGNLNDLVFRDNVTHSNAGSGLFADGIVDRETLAFRPGHIGPGLLQIEDHTAYGNLEWGIWIRGADPRVDNAMLLDNEVAFEVHASSESILSNSLIVGDTDNTAAISDITRAERNNTAAWDTGVHLYGQTQLGMDGVHFETKSGHEWLAVRSEAIRAPEKATWLKDITLKGIDHKLLWTGQFFDVNDKQSTNRIVDLDGSFTGTPGAFLTQDMIGDLLAERTGFLGVDAGKGYYDTALTEGGSFGHVFLGRSNKTPFDITRSDGQKYEYYDPGTSTIARFLISTRYDQEAAYLVELEEPGQIQLRVDGLKLGEAVVFEMPNVADYHLDSLKVGDAPLKTVDGFEALFNSDVSASFHSGDSLFVRVVMVADQGSTFAGVDNDRNPSRAFITSEGTDSGFSFTLTPVDNPVPRGESDFTPELLQWLARTEGVSGALDIPELPDLEQRQAPERFDSTSETVENTNGLPLWSASGTWGGTPPGPGDVVVIQDGMKVVLDTSVEVAGIIVHGPGSALIVEDQPGKTIDLVADWVLVDDGALFQAGTEADPIDTDFTLTLTGDDPDFDLDVGATLMGMVPDTIFSVARPEGGSFFGDPGANMIQAGMGSDLVVGRAGDDTLLGEAGNDTLRGGADNDYLAGGSGADSLFGSFGEDTLHGEDGDDLLEGNQRADHLFGGAGNDTLRGGGNADRLEGGADDDLMFGSIGDDTLVGGTGADTLSGNRHADHLFGESGDDILRGGGGTDYLQGGSGDDKLFGGAREDTLSGGAGADMLWGNEENDVFLFRSTADSRLGAEDLIFDFSGAGVAGGDRIDLSQIDADITAALHQAFTFLGNVSTAEGLAAGPGALWVEDVNGQTLVYGEVDGKNGIDLAIRIGDGLTLAADYNAGDFIL